MDVREFGWAAALLLAVAVLGWFAADIYAVAAARLH